MVKKLNLTLVIIIMLLFSANLHAGELTFGWNKINESGNIRDMEFMPDNDYFIMSTVTDIQIRRTETGELVNTYSIPAVQLEFTPDSTRLISIYGNRIEIRNLSDMSLIRQHIIPEGTDTAGYDIYESSIRLNEMVVDPILPFVYVIRVRSGTLENTKSFSISRIVIYNYETMQEVGVLSIGEEDNSHFEKIAISKDGKYLAVNNQGYARLRVWSLDTRQKVSDYRLYADGNSSDIWCEPSCTKFSEINSDIIYFSGKFPKSKNEERIFGMVTYSITESRIIDSTFGEGLNRIYDGYFSLFDNEERFLIAYYGFISVGNIIEKKKEFLINIDSVDYTKRWDSKTIYSYIKKSFIGYNLKSYSSGKYNSNNAIREHYDYGTIIYPNPNTGIVSLQTHCQNPVQSYEISDIHGLIVIPLAMVNTDVDLVAIDISALPSGTYFLRFSCGSTVTAYKVIKEN